MIKKITTRAVEAIPFMQRLTNNKERRRNFCDDGVTGFTFDDQDVTCDLRKIKQMKACTQMKEREALS